MNFWTIVVIFVGTLGAVGIASFFVPSLANFISAVFSNLFSALRQVIQFLVDMLPKPLKILLFIGLFASVGIYAYNFTYGAQFVCTDGQKTVEKVGWLEGMTYKFTATDNDVFKENQQANDLLALNTTNPLSAVGVEQENGSDLIKSTSTSYKGTQYDVKLALMPREEPVSQAGLISFFEANDADVWNKWFGEDRHIEYQLCYDAVTETCILERKNVATGTGGCGAGTVFSSLDPWQGITGTVYYYADADSRKITANYNEVSHTVLGELFTFGTQNGLTNRCSAISDSTLNNVISDVDGNVLYSSAANAYKTVLQGKEPKMVTLVQNDWFGGTTSFTVPVYDVDWVAVFKESMNSTVFSDAVLTLVGSGDVQDTRGCNGAPNSQCNRNQLLAEAVPVKYSKSDFVQVKCDTKTADPADTTLTIAGINILDPTTMALFVLLGACLSGIIWLKQLFRPA